jgi:hypothetical protein
MSITTFCNAVLQADATYLSMCLGGAASAWDAQLTAGTTCTAVAAAVSAGRVTYDPTKASACLAATTALGCDAGASTSAMGLTDCKAALAGTVAANGTCYNSVDCAGTNFCSGLGATGGSCTGTCKPLVAAGATCAAGDQCVSGYVCGSAGGDAGTSLACVTSTPANLAASGAACGYNSTTKVNVSCAAGLVCNSSTKTCQAPIKAGATCTPGAGECDLFTYCDPTSKTCKNDPGVGGACGSSPSQDFIPCTGASYCKFVTGSLVGTCTALSAAGAACKTAEECASKVCTAAGDAGGGTCAMACTQE